MTYLICSVCRTFYDKVCLVQGTTICVKCLEKAAQAATENVDTTLGNTVTNLIKENDIYD